MPVAILLDCRLLDAIAFIGNSALDFRRPRFVFSMPPCRGLGFP